MSERPRPPALVRARHCQDWLSHVDREDDPWRGRFHARVDPEVRALIEGASRVGWLPVRCHVHLADVLEETFGAARAHGFYRRVASVWLENPLFGPVMRTFRRLLDLTPASVVRWVPKGWDLSFKDNGEMIGEQVGPGHSRLVYVGLSPECRASTPWLSSSQGSIYGVLDVIGTEGVVRLDLAGRDEGRMVIDIEWTPRSGEGPVSSST